MDGLRRVLEGLEGRRVRRRVEDAVTRIDRNGSDEGDENTESDETTSVDKVAAYDARLAALEKSLGVEKLDAPGSEAVNMPLLPSLEMLERQMSALMTASSLASLEAASGRIRKLREDAEQLSLMARDGHTNGDSSPTTSDDRTTAEPTISRTDMEKLQALYALLPTLQSLSPTVPALIERLQSLRTLHSGAANVAAELEEVERRQEEMDAELKAWREGRWMG